VVLLVQQRYNYLVKDNKFLNKNCFDMKFYITFVRHQLNTVPLWSYEQAAKKRYLYKKTSADTKVDLENTNARR
jgi:hypothetical protein